MSVLACWLIVGFVGVLSERSEALVFRLAYFASYPVVQSVFIFTLSISRSLRIYYFSLYEEEALRELIPSLIGRTQLFRSQILLSRTINKGSPFTNREPLIVKRALFMNRALFSNWGLTICEVKCPNYG